VRSALAALGVAVVALLSAACRSDRIELPTRWEGGYPYVDATIDGHGPYRLLLDSGTSFVCLSKRVADELHLERVPIRAGQDGQEVDANGDSVRAREGATIREMHIGRVDFPGGQVLIWDLSLLERAAKTRLDGILPACVFAEALLTIDYERRSVTLERGELPPADGRTVYQLGDDPYRPLVTMTIGGAPCEVIIDTGYDGFLQVPEAREPALRFKAPVVPIGCSVTFAGMRRTRAGRLSEPIDWGGRRIEEPIVQLISSDYAVAGAELLSEFRVTFDFGHSRVRFESTTGDPILRQRIDDPGVGFLRDGGSWTVAYVLDGTPASRAGLRAGDRVETIDGRLAREIDVSAYVGGRERGDVLHMRVTGENGTRDVDVEVVTLVE
jgi:predicted aspartyl protease